LDDRAAEFLLGQLDLELSWLGLVKVSPLGRKLGISPAEGVPRQGYFERFGETGLSGPVSAGDDYQPRAGLKVDFDRRADPTKPLHGEGSDERTSWLFHGRAPGVWPCGCGSASKDFVDRGAADHGSQSKIYGVVGSITA